ncbi:MAG: helix-turn-helix domain-containing protein [Lachnospiraceae bacterium]|nr:helix-turn-helix domain-containing protein [Lachnospiraceae bacterium]
MTETEKKEFLAGFGQRVRKARLKKDLTLEELANRLGYTTGNARSSMQKIEAGKSDLGASKIHTLSKILDVPLEHLMGWDEEAEQKKIHACEIFEQCYGKEAFQTVSAFLKLDDTDRQNITGMISVMLSNEKYSIQEGLKHA